MLGVTESHWEILVIIVTTLLDNRGGVIHFRSFSMTSFVFWKQLLLLFT